MLFINLAKLPNFTDANKICTARNDLNELLNLLEKGIQVTIKCLSDSNMIVSPKKFHVIPRNYCKRQNKSNYNHKYINNAEVKSEQSVTLLSTEIDKKINFEKHISAIFKR